MNLEILILNATESLEEGLIEIDGHTYQPSMLETMGTKAALMIEGKMSELVEIVEVEISQLIEGFVQLQVKGVTLDQVNSGKLLWFQNKGIGWYTCECDDFCEHYIPNCCMPNWLCKSCVDETPGYVDCPEGWGHGHKPEDRSCEICECKSGLYY